MNHLSLVLKIISSGLTEDKSRLIAKARLLAEKLEADGEALQSKQILETIEALERGNQDERPEGMTKEQKALGEAVKVLYFDDNADYASALWKVVELLGGEEAVELLESDEEAAFTKYSVQEPNR